MKRKYTLEELKRLDALDIVESATDKGVVFTYEFKIELYDLWLENPGATVIRHHCIKNGFPVDLAVYSGLFDGISCSFKKGKPHNGKYSKERYHKRNEQDNEILLNSGYFKHNPGGISFSDEFIKLAASKFQEQSVNETLKSVGLDPVMVGYHRIYSLERKLKEGLSPNLTCTNYNEIVEEHLNHPYIECISGRQIELKKHFYAELAPLIHHYSIDELLEAYEINPQLFHMEHKRNLRDKISRYKKTKLPKLPFSEQLLRIQTNRLRLHEKLVTENFQKLGEYFKTGSYLDKHKIIEMISKLPKDPEKQFTMSHILSLVNISRSHFYTILNDKDYRKRQMKKERQTEKDIEVIKATMEYKGFEKGARQIHMMMKQVTGQQFGLKKIRRLMRLGNLKCNVRKANQSRRIAKQKLEQNRKNNILRRRFRLHKPNEVILTDVTYLTYGDGKRAYGSAAIDPVTGKLKAFNISESNNLSLALDTLSTIESEHYEPGTIFHSDQGGLYLSDTFQLKVKAMHFTQSMSKRGNCWDNAPQESFFGHFKDECNLKQCKTIEEVKELVEKYIFYYNNERHIWSRNKMTPVEFEAYLMNLSADEYTAHMQKEEERYIAMKAKANHNAKLRATTLLV